MKVRGPIALTLSLVLACFAEEGGGSGSGSGNGEATESSGATTSSADATSATSSTSSGGSGGVDDTSAGTTAPTTGSQSEGSDDGSSGATTSMTSDSGGAACGNDTLEPGEECDDGNIEPGDGCHSDCTVSKSVFLTKTTLPGSDLGGLLGAHAICQLEADDAGLAGEFKAWLSTSNIAAMTELAHSTDAYRLVDGTLVANDWADLTDGVLTTQIDLLADGGEVRGDLRVWTGTGPSGEIILPSCGDWSMDAISGHVGRVSWAVADDWTDFTNDSCNESRGLYCFEQ
jgi:cysteine-rich repeat protein